MFVGLFSKPNGKQIENKNYLFKKPVPSGGSIQRSKEGRKTFQADCKVQLQARQTSADKIGKAGSQKTCRGLKTQGEGSS
jgi:hypothetical protein